MECSSLNYTQDFNQLEIQRLSSIAFIPVVSITSQSVTEKSQLRLLAPNKCYLDRESSTAFHSQIFAYIDFGSLANNFLKSCGVRNQPTIDELAQGLVTDPRKACEQAGGYDKYVMGHTVGLTALLTVL